jgi:hypothetical protein
LGPDEFCLKEKIFEPERGSQPCTMPSLAEAEMAIMKMKVQ